MRTRRSTLTIGVLTALMASAVHAQNLDVQAQLLEQGQYWQARSDSQRAAEAWQKVLRLDARQVDALYGMGLASVRQNQPQQAQDYLARLQALSPVPWQARQLEQDIAMMQPENRALLDEARRLVVAGERNQATEVFRKLFAGRSPEGSIGHEYYTNLAYTRAGWPEARRGMERLMRQWPDDATLMLSYARQLIHHEDSRVQGARLLARLSKRSDIGGAAEESWRLALIWTGPPNASQVPMFEEFLRAHPDDQDIRALLNKGGQRAVGPSRNPLVDSGLRALERGDQAAAEQAFLARLAAKPDDHDALGGLGVLRQQQGRDGEAEQLLLRAVSKGGRQWQAALDSVRYWSLLQQARDLQASGQTARAEDAVARAMRLDPRPVDGRLTLADIQAQAGKFDDASAHYRQVLAAQPGHAQAIRGLIGVLSQTGQADEALRLLDGLLPEEQAEFGHQGQLRALRATQQAEMAEQRGDLPGARDALRDAVRADPDNVWTRFSLARLYVRGGEPHKARELMDAFLVTHPGNIDALYTRALLSVELEEWDKAQKVIERIPAAQRSAEMNALASQIMLTTQVRHALTLARSGQRQQALARLDRLQSMAAGSTAFTATLASAYADAGEAERAQEMMRALIAQSATPSNELMLQYAAVLLQTGEDMQVYTILSDLQDQAMGAATRKHYDDILHLYRVRQAERLREGGDLATAYDILAPALAQRPGDVGATSTLARMYTANGDDAKALNLYKPLVQRHPQDVGVLLGAANAAVLARDKAFANRTLKQFVKLQNTDPAALTEAARIYRALGRHNEAMALLHTAVAIEQREQGVGPNPFQNPFQSHRVPRVQRMRTATAAVPPPADTFLDGEQAVAVTSAVPPPADIFLDGEQVVAVVGNGKPLRADVDQDARRHSTMVSDARPQMVSMTSRMAREQDDPDVARAPRSMLADDGISPAQRALDDLRRSRAAHLAQGVSVRSNNSEPGLSRLSDVEMPFQANISVGEGVVAFGVTLVSLNAGRMNGEAATRFGGGTASAAGLGPQRDEGVGVSVAYTRPEAGFKADIGTTPMGFQYKTAVGGVSIERPLPGNAQVRYGAALSRRAVTESMTSFAGTRDVREGLSWGGVTANGGRVQLGYDDGEAGAYAYASAHRLLGHHVKSNTRAELGGGLYRHLRNEPGHKATFGLSATVLGHANNQGFYTYGHGGYFSPQRYFSLGIPVMWAQRSDRFTWQLKGSVGFQAFRQNGVDYFPGDPARQAASGLRYAEQSHSGLGYNLEAAGEYRFGRKLFVGGAFELDNSRDYRLYNAGMYMRYIFEDMTESPLMLPVSPYRSPYSN